MRLTNSTIVFGCANGVPSSGDPIVMMLPMAIEAGAALANSWATKPPRPTARMSMSQFPFWRASVQVLMQRRSVLSWVGTDRWVVVGPDVAAVAVSQLAKQRIVEAPKCALCLAELVV